MKIWRKTILGFALVLGTAPAVAACDDNSTYADAACVDTQTNIRLPNEQCSPDYGAPIGYHSWAYSSYGYGQQEVPVIYIGQPVQRDVYVLQRPARINVNHISAPAPTRPPGVTATSVSEPSQSFLTDKRMASARATKPELVQRGANPGIQRGDFGVPSAQPSAVPPPVRTLNSPAPGRATTPTSTTPKPTTPRK